MMLLPAVLGHFPILLVTNFVSGGGGRGGGWGLGRGVGGGGEGEGESKREGVLACSLLLLYP